MLTIGWTMTAAGVEARSGPSFPFRALWFVFVGWWLTGFVMALAWAAGVTLIGLPITFYLANRIPTFLTLRPRREHFILVSGADGSQRYQRVETEQSPLLVRLAYFVLIGWWLSAFWMTAAWFLCATIIGLPLGLMMVNRVPFIFTLHRGYA
jgi:uncharacterized membrane protein YccF (DUF307 family)